MYPQDVVEVVLIELIANSLDAGATRIEIRFEPNQRTLVVKDNGRGMTESDFDQYHDFASGLKTRGEGIGFAGVGAKISFNIADRVITETRCRQFSRGSNWYFKSKKKLVWEDIKPTHLRTSGTRVEVKFREDTKVSYSSRSDIIGLIQRSYLPLLDVQFLELYERMNVYSKTLRFVINGEQLRPQNIIKTFQLEKTRVFFPKRGGKRIGYGILGVAPSEYPLGQDISGLLLCTRGKVIKPELFSQFPVEIGPRIFGLVEIPDFVKYLTTSKTDFIRRGKHRQLESLCDPIREEFRGWLIELGVQQVRTSRADEAAKLEQELKKILDDIPELNEFFGFRIPKSTLTESSKGPIKASQHEGMEVTFPLESGVKGVGPGPVNAGDEEGLALVEEQKDGTIKAKPISRRGKRGPRITFAEAPRRVELAWVEGNSVVLNSGHPCYKKIQGRSSVRRLHNFYGIAVAIQRFLGEDEKNPDLNFIDRMMAAWGKK
jgi:hypothetical protein